MAGGEAGFDLVQLWSVVLGDDLLPDIYQKVLEHLEPVVHSPGLVSSSDQLAKSVVSLLRLAGHLR